MSMSVNVHATGRYGASPHFTVQDLYAAGPPGGDMMLDIDSTDGTDITVFLSPDTARALVAALAGHLHLLVNEGPPLESEIENV